MRKSIFVAALGVSVAVFLAASRPAAAQFYAQHNLLSDGALPADATDANLVNPWGLVASSTSPWWIANNQTGTSTVYNAKTNAIAFFVTVPGAPTGVVFNGGTDFKIHNAANTVEAPALFIFASEDGSISGWNRTVDPNAVVAVPGSETAVYKGLAIASTDNGDRIYATNFRAGTVDVFDGSFKPVDGGFGDPTIPAGYAPFGIRRFGDKIFVTYALQDADKMDDVPGEGHGFVNMFDTAGKLLGRVASRGPLNSPWGMELAPDDFGKFSGDLLVGNFGDGRIHAFDPTKLDGRGEFQHRGPLHSAGGPPIRIDGLWSLSFGNGANAGPKNVLFFTAGPFDESHGLFGTITAVPPPGRQR